MKEELEEDFVLTNQKKGGGRRKQSETKKKERNDISCYSSKHIRNVENRKKLVENK
jgi:hypothetical protein